MDRAWFLVESFFASPIMWGVVTLLAVALALSGRLSMSAATGVLWLAFLTALFGVYRAEVILKADPLMRYLILGCCAFGFAAGTVALNRWMTRPKTEAITGGQPNAQPDSQPHEAAEKNASNPRPTLESLFQNDFPYAVKYSQVAEMDFASGFKANIPYHVYFDFQGKSEFVGFFVARSPKTFDICVGLPNVVPQVRDAVRKTVEIQDAQAGQQTSLSDLTFTGRVFIYHEDFLTLEQIVALRELFTKANMQAEFRSTDYLAAHIIHPSQP